MYVCDNETTLDKVSKWIGSGPRTTLADGADADIMKTIIECVKRECYEMHALNGQCSSTPMGTPE